MKPDSKENHLLNPDSKLTRKV